MKSGGRGRGLGVAAQRSRLHCGPLLQFGDVLSFHQEVAAVGQSCESPRVPIPFLCTRSGAAGQSGRRRALGLSSSEQEAPLPGAPKLEPHLLVSWALGRPPGEPRARTHGSPSWSALSHVSGGRCGRAPATF